MYSFIIIYAFCYIAALYGLLVYEDDVALWDFDTQFAKCLGNLTFYLLLACLYAFLVIPALVLYGLYLITNIKL